MAADMAPERAPAFLSGGGDMGRCIRAFDWAATPLGPMHGWPGALRTTLRILLSTNHPVFLFWGPQHICFYNDAYSRSLGPEKHPSMLGMPGQQAWDEIWPVIGPQIDQVLSGQGATWHENQLIPITRHGRLDQVYWTYSYGPVDDDSAPGGIGGVLVLVTETSQQINALQQSQAEKDRWLALFDQAPGFICALDGPGHHFTYTNRRYQELTGGRAVVGRRVQDCLPEMVQQGFIGLLDSVFCSGEPFVAQGAAVRLDLPGLPAPELRYLDFVYQPIRDAAGQVTGVLVEGHDVTERTAATQELKLTLQSISDAVAAFDADLRILYVNPAAEALLQRPAAQLLGQPLAAVFGGDTGVRLEAECRRAAAGEVREFEDVLAPQGLWFQIRCYPRAGGGVASYFQDISDRKRADRALRESEQRARERAEELEAVMASMPAFVWIAHDRDCLRVSGNLRSYEMLGLRVGENPSASGPQAAGRSFVELRDGHPVPAQQLPLQTAARTGQSIPPGELSFAFADGSVRHLYGGAAPLRDDGGQVRGAVAAFLDITALKNAQAQLQERERELRSLADNTPDVLARFDRQHRHVFVNAAITSATGLLPERVLGRTQQQLGMPAAQGAQWAHAIDQVFVQAQPSDFEFSIDTAQGTRHHTVRLVPEFNATGAVQHVLAIVQDVTERRHAEGLLRDAERRKDEFLATLAHELRNPLAPLRTGLQWLERGGDGPSAAAVRGMMGRQLNHMVRLIDDLLDISRISAGKMVLRRELVRLQTVAEVALESSRPALQAARHTLQLQLPDHDVWVNADLTRLAQVVSNLLNNAAKYTPEGGQVLLRVQDDGQQAVLSVSDTGLGIPQAMLGEVFQMFAQVNSTLHRAQGGLGIGLALARSIVELHGGSIRAHSEGLGSGSVFSLQLPAVAQGPTGAEAAAGDTGAAAAAPAPLRVLVVDDNRDAADSLAMLLQQMGHLARSVHGGQEALELVKGWTPDLAFIDIGMPKVSGFDLVRSLRQQGLQALLVALTGWGTQADTDRSRDAGFDLHLTKPLAPQALQEALQRALQARAVPGSAR